MNKLSYHALIIGASAGGFQALTVILPQLPKNLPLAVIIINHRMDTLDTYLTEYLGKICHMPVQDAEHLLPIKESNIYIAPPGYHLLVADDYCFNLSVDPRVNSSRPSLDVGFETAAEVYGNHLIGVVLTGANSDGAAGLKMIKMQNGYTIAQDPKTAESSIMPLAAINATAVDYIGTLDQIAKHICFLCGMEAKAHE